MEYKKVIRKPYLWYASVPDMTYNVFGGTLNLAQSISHRTW